MNEAGREYRKNIKSYKGMEIESMDDVFERLEVLDSHFNSTTFDKVQGGEKIEVTRSDMITLFGEPDEILEDVAMKRVDIVYQYYYEDITLNFHQNRSDIDEFVIEDFTGVLYDSDALDQLFIHMINLHQEDYNKQTQTYEPLLEENFSPEVINQAPTRKINQSGWRTWGLKQRYYDTGTDDYAPLEYVLFGMNEDSDDAPALQFMERRYNEVYIKEDSQGAVERKKEALFNFKKVFEEKETADADKTILVEDFSREFGDVSLITYDFRYGILSVSWLTTQAEDIEEITVSVALTDASEISDMDDVARLEIADFESRYLSPSDRILSRDDFVGSK